MVGDVGQQVGRLARRLHQHAVALQAEARRAQPHGAVLVEHEPGGAQVRERPVDELALEQGVLVEVRVEAHAQRREGPLDVGEDRLRRARLEARLVGLAPGGADLRSERARDVDEILALVALVGQLHGVAQLLQVARAQ